MILSKPSKLGLDDLRAGLEAAKSLLDVQWLQTQHQREPNDPLLLHLKVEKSPQFHIHGIRFGLPSGMHPIAEAVKVAEEVLLQYQRDGRFLGSTSFYLLMALRDVVTYRSKIENIDSRLQRLYSEDQWKPTLYELATAAAYVSAGYSVRLLQEDQEAQPDIQLQTDPSLFIECKAKLSHEQEVVDFTARWRREVLGTVSAYLRRVDAGFIVRVTLDNEAAMPAIPSVIESMVTAGETVRTNSDFKINITPIHPETCEIGPEPMSVLSAEFWKRALDFDEWLSWHYILPGGEFEIVTLSNAVAKSFRRPKLVCVRSTRLADNTIKVLSALKDACRRQLRKHNPGVIHVLINTNLAGLDRHASVEAVERLLREVTTEVFRNYRRLLRVNYDMVTPPEPGQFQVRVRRLSLVNKRCEHQRTLYREPPPVVIL